MLNPGWGSLLVCAVMAAAPESDREIAAMARALEADPWAAAMILAQQQSDLRAEFASELAQVRAELVALQTKVPAVAGRLQATCQQGTSLQSR